jgi:hypothetical protein
VETHPTHLTFEGDLFMKVVIRVAALAFIVAAAVAGNSLPKTANVKMAFAPTGPAPTCNPFRQPCPNIR